MRGLHPRRVTPHPPSLRSGTLSHKGRGEARAGSNQRALARHQSSRLHISNSHNTQRHCEPTGRANARPMAGSAKQSMLPRSKCGLLRRFAPRNDANLHVCVRILAARYARGLQNHFASLRIEGAGNAGRAMRPRPRMQNKTSIRVSHHGHTGTTRHSPRNGFTAYFALSSVTTLFDTVACASSHRLDANDWGVGTTRLRRTRQHHSSRALPASTASRSTLMTCATPLLSERDLGINELIWVKGKQKYFCKRG